MPSLIQDATSLIKDRPSHFKDVISLIKDAPSHFKDATSLMEKSHRTNPHSSRTPTHTL